MNKHRAGLCRIFPGVVAAAVLCGGCSTPVARVNSSGKQTQVVLAIPEKGLPTDYDADGWPVLSTSVGSTPTSSRARVFMEPAGDADSPKIRIDAAVITADLKMDEAKWVDENGYQRWPDDLDDRSAALLLSQQANGQALMSRFPSFAGPPFLLNPSQRVVMVLTEGGQVAYVASSSPKATTRPGMQSEPDIKVTTSGVVVDARASVDSSGRLVHLELSSRFRELTSLIPTPDPAASGRSGWFVQVPVQELASLDAHATIQDGRWLLLRTFPITRFGDRIDASRTVTVEYAHGKTQTYRRPPIYVLIKASIARDETGAQAEPKPASAPAENEATALPR